jgi:hypothetical protein
MQSSSVNPMDVRLSGRIAEEHVDTIREVIGWEKGRAALDNTFSYGNDLKQADAHQPPRSIVAIPSGCFREPKCLEFEMQSST